MTDDDARRLEALYEYYPAVFAFLRRFGFSHDESRDLAQTVFVRVCEGMATYRGEAKWGYLEPIARRVALNAIRDRHAGKRQGIEVSEDAARGRSDDRAVPADEALIRKATSERLRGAVDRLESGQRICILLYLADFSYDEIAKTLDITTAAVKSRLHAARERLTDLLGEDSGLGGADDQ